MVQNFRLHWCREEFNGYPVARCWGPKEEAALIVPKDGESLGLQV